MTGDRSERAKQLFEQALALPAAERGAFLADACAGDQALLTELQSLLGSADAAHAWFEDLAARIVRPALGVAAADFDALAPGVGVAHYEIVARVGSGGMGVIYRARDVRLARHVALKLLPPHLTRNASARERLLREARAASALEHPNIATIFEIGDAPDGRTFIAMAWCEGETLRARLEREPHVDTRVATSIARQLADALAAAHRAGVVHRDVKPANIIVGEDHAVKLVDFGIARLAGEETTRAGGTLGTVAYMSPEQTRGEAVDGRTDVWSLGVVLYEMLAGRRPFRGDAEAVIIQAIRSDEPEPLAVLRADVAPALAAIVARCLAREPTARGDAAGVAAALRAIERGEAPAEAAASGAIGAPPVAAAVRRLAATAGRRWRGIALATVVATVVFGAGAYAARARAPHGELDARRVLVATLENRTGDDALAPIGSMAADWLIQGLAQAGMVEVVPVTTALAASRFVYAADSPVRGDDAPDRERVLRALATETRAGIVITGAYYEQRDSIYFRVTITDVTSGRLLRALEPVATTRDQVMDGVELLRRSVVGTLGPHLDPRMQPQAGHMRAPPSVEAYRAFSEGLDLFVATDWRGAIARFRDAAAADSGFVMPMLYAAIAYGNAADYATTDSILAWLRPQRHSLGAFERLAFDMLAATTAGDWEAYYRAHADAPRLAPNSLAHYGVAYGALRVNRPAEAVAVLRGLDPERGELRGWLAYWSELTMAQHTLGRHRDELRSARRARALHPSEPRALEMEVVALAALGRRRELAQLLQRELEAYPAPPALLRRAGVELLAHGDSSGGMALLRESLERVRGGSVASIGERFFLARAHDLVGEHDEAATLLRAVIEEQPALMSPRAMAATIAARSGDTAAARDVDAWLAGLDRPYLHGVNTYLRARIAAQLGEPDRAVRLLRQAWREGHVTRPVAHDDPDLRPLRDHPAFREFMRPAG
jgi:tRNA A-37 threonylcarbamoyl transferase component Bud32/tetratricopeptide (TPR) repeat protein